jgi:D-alanyl-D-alanine carboxypeptidase
LEQTSTAKITTESAHIRDKDDDLKGKIILNFIDFEVNKVQPKILAKYQTYFLIALGYVLMLALIRIMPIYPSHIIELPKNLVAQKSTNVVLFSDSNLKSVRKISNYRFDLVGKAIPDETANEILVYDKNSQQIFFSKNVESKQPIASITKLMTAMIVLDSYKMEDYITFKGDYADYPHAFGIIEGDKMQVPDVVKALLISSFNDVAEAVANSYPGGPDEFYKKVAEKSNTIGLTNTQFLTASGLFDEKNFSTASDVKKIATVALTYPFIVQTVKRDYDVIMLTTSEGLSDKVDIVTTNEMIFSNQDTLGLKTGYTLGAGQCFVGYFGLLSGEELITIVLGSNDRFGETQNLLNQLSN